MIRTKHENAIAKSVAKFDVDVSEGDALRQPDGREAALHRADHGDAVRRTSPASSDTAMNSTTATMAPGTLGMKRLNPRMITIVPIA